MTSFAFENLTSLGQRFVRVRAEAGTLAPIHPDRYKLDRRETGIRCAADDAESAAFEELQIFMERLKALAEIGFQTVRPNDNERFHRAFAGAERSRVFK